MLKFFFVRDPYDRLVSVYVDKFELDSKDEPIYQGEHAAGVATLCSSSSSSNSRRRRSIATPAMATLLPISRLMAGRVAMSPSAKASLALIFLKSFHKRIVDKHIFTLFIFIHLFCT